MSVTCHELAESRSFSVTATGATETQRWIAYGEQESQLIYDALIAATPARVGGLVRQSLKPDHQGGGVWLVTIDYSSGIDANSGVGASPNEPTAPGIDDPLDPSGTGGGGQGPPDLGGGGGPGGGGGGGQAAEPQGFVASFDTTGATTKITQSFETVLSRATFDPVGGPSTAPDYHGAIGVGKDGDVEGIDVFTGKLEFSIQIKRRVSLRYIDLLEEYTGCVNDRPFWNRETGEVLFLGATGEHTTGGVFTVTYKFARSKNRLRVKVGPNITLPRVGGWNALWVAYGPDKDQGRGVERPIAAYVERVYDEKDFRKLGIG